MTGPILSLADVSNRTFHSASSDSLSSMPDATGEPPLKQAQSTSSRLPTPSCSPLFVIIPEKKVEFEGELKEGSTDSDTVMKSNRAHNRNADLITSERAYSNALISQSSLRGIKEKKSCNCIKASIVTVLALVAIASAIRLGVKASSDGKGLDNIWVASGSTLGSILIVIITIGCISKRRLHYFS